jgi:RNA polymerase sigma-70 factor (ECF subfamily)
LDLNTEQLIQGCQSGERDAQKAFFMAYSGYAYGLILRYMDDEFRSKDVLQEVFIIVFRSLKKFQYESEPKLLAWIKTISVRETIRHIKFDEKFAGDELQLQKESADEEYSVLAKMNAEEMLKLLQQLPEGYRVVFNMYAIEGYSHREIASILDISESTSRSQLTRARKMLQQLTLKLTSDAR